VKAKNKKNELLNKKNKVKRIVNIKDLDQLRVVINKLQNKGGKLIFKASEENFYLFMNVLSDTNIKIKTKKIKKMYEFDIMSDNVIENNMKEISNVLKDGIDDNFFLDTIDRYKIYKI
jgi:hypothetical protein